MDRWQTDWTFSCPSRFIADRVAAGRRPTSFSILFTRSVTAPGRRNLVPIMGLRPRT